MMQSKRAAAGLTMIELMVVVSIVALLAMVAAPSFKRFIDVQRLRSINSQLITDIQFVRAEAASRNRKVKIEFDRTGSCYTVLIGSTGSCDCRNPPGSACSGLTREIRTVQVPPNTGITLAVPTAQTANSMLYDPATGRIETAVADTFLEPDAPFKIEVRHSELGGFVTSVEPTGRPTTCSPSGQISGVPACP